jgi:hypothetical protein
MPRISPSQISYTCWIIRSSTPIYHEVPILVGNQLVHRDRDPPIRFSADALWLDPRIQQFKLTSPVIPDGSFSQHATSLHPIGSINLGMHRGQACFDFAPVEGRVHLARQFEVGPHRLKFCRKYFKDHLTRRSAWHL